MNVAAESLSRARIRKITEKLRELIGCSEKAYFPIVEFIEWIMGDPENDFDYEIVEAQEMQDMYGNMNTGLNVMKIREDVYIGAINGNPRHRFTLCHELGHYLLHQPERVSYARGEIPTYRNPEWQANTFAAELMAPYKLIKNMGVAEIMEQCGMSRQAAEIQYKICRKY